MSKHRKRPRDAAPKGKADHHDVSAAGITPRHMTSRGAGTARIEVRGLDLELVATPSPKATRSSVLEDAMLSVSVVPARPEPTEAERLQSEVLREELAQIAVVLDLPSKRRIRPKILTDAVALATPRDFKHLIQMLAPVIVVVGLMTAASTFHTPAPPELPPGLLGGWVTSNPDYQGRELGFVDAELVIRLAPDAPLERYPITALTSRTSSDTTVLRLTYTTDGGPVELHARLVGGANPKLVFDRPSGLVWERRTN